MQISLATISLGRAALAVSLTPYCDTHPPHSGDRRMRALSHSFQRARNTGDSVIAYRCVDPVYDRPAVWGAPHRVDHDPYTEGCRRRREEEHYRSLFYVFIDSGCLALLTELFGIAFLYHDPTVSLVLLAVLGQLSVGITPL